MSPIGFHDETERLRRGVEVLVATPGKLSKLIESNQIDLSMLQVHVVVGGYDAETYVCE
jgi:superfamily II DNA/RNA helicase